MKQRLVLIDDAKVATLAIEVKALHIGKKQVTLAVFRQLPEAQLIRETDPQLELQGMPWGWVNYHWTDCSPSENGEHVHVVWQKDSRLFQMPVSTKVPARWKALVDQDIKDIEAQRGKLEGIVALKLATEGERFTFRRERNVHVAEGHGVTVFGYTAERIQEGQQSIAEGQPAEYHQHWVRCCRKDIARVWHALYPHAMETGDDGPTREGLLDALTQIRSEYTEWSNRRTVSTQMWAMRYQELLSLGQLFIAV